MNVATKIGLFLLFISLHLNIYGLFVESQVLFYLSFMVVATVATLQRNTESKLKLNRGYVIAALLFVSLIPRYFSAQGYQYGNYQTCTIWACWLLFFVFSFLFYKNRYILKSFFWIIVATIIIEIVMGFGQLFGWIDNNDGIFSLGGSFGNPGAYAGYLAVVSPLIFSVLLTYRKNKKAENQYYTLIACFVFILYLLFISESRGAWLACALGCTIVLCGKYSLIQKAKAILHTAFCKTVAIIGMIVVVFVGAFFLYQLKADSAFGRVLIWKVTALTPHDNLLWGNGIGHFEANYGKWQADYFANSGGTESERYVADYVTCAYNEFIEMFIEQGALVTILFALLFFFAFKQKNTANKPFVLGAKASLAGILVLMCVSYPLKVTPVYLYLIFCLAVIFYQPHSMNQRYKTIPIWFWKSVIFLLGFFLVIGSAGLHYLYGYYQLRKGQHYVFSNQLDKGIETYKSVPPILQHDGAYHFYYGSALYLNKQYDTSVEESQKSIQTSSNPSSYILLGNNYKELQQPEKAVDAYLTAANMTPSKLYPKYLLAKLYISMADYKNAEKWAQEILNTKEKVPTTAAKEIKQEMETFLKK